MITHIVFITLKSELSENEKLKAKREISEALEKLPAEINEILYYEVASNQKQGGSDISLISKFKNIGKLNIYRKHPKHLEVLDIITKFKESSTFIDYESPNSIFEK